MNKSVRSVVLLASIFAMTSCGAQFKQVEQREFAKKLELAEARITKDKDDFECHFTINYKRYEYVKLVVDDGAISTLDVDYSYSKAQAKVHVVTETYSYLGKESEPEKEEWTNYYGYFGTAGLGVLEEKNGSYNMMYSDYELEEGAGNANMSKEDYVADLVGNIVFDYIGLDLVDADLTDYLETDFVIEDDYITSKNLEFYVGGEGDFKYVSAYEGKDENITVGGCNIAGSISEEIVIKNFKLASYHYKAKTDGTIYGVESQEYLYHYYDEIEAKASKYKGFKLPAIPQ